MAEKLFMEYIQASYPLLWVSTYEEYRTMATLVKELEDYYKTKKNASRYSIYTWDRCDGIIKKSMENGILRSIKKIGDMPIVDPLEALTWADTPVPVTDNDEERKEAFQKLHEADENTMMPESSILFLKDFHHYIKKDVICRKIRNLTPVMKFSGKVIIILSPAIEIPLELQKEVTVINCPLPTREELKIVLKGACESANDAQNGAKVAYPKNDEDILNAALGLTAFEAENAFSISLVKTRSLDQAIIQREKASVIKKSDLLEVMKSDVNPEDVGGSNNLMAWLEARKDLDSEEARKFGLLLPPKGVLLVGPPGTGKTYIAKCVSSIMKRPLLRFDTGKIYDKFVGETEGKLRKVIEMAEAIAPCVMLIDEFDKCFAGSDNSNGDSSGVSQRVLGSFLTWMQERTADVFIVATANDVSHLPPPLLRSGRFDGIFWVDIPDDVQREEIIKIHIRKVGRDPSKFDTAKLTSVSDKFTGSEIQEWVKESLVHAFHKKEELNTQHLLDKKNEISLIAKVMADEIKRAQAWADEHEIKRAYVKPISLKEPKIMGGKRSISI